MVVITTHMPTLMSVPEREGLKAGVYSKYQRCVITRQKLLC